jgi:hypothetical protein
MFGQTLNLKEKKTKKTAAHRRLEPLRRLWPKSEKPLFTVEFFKGGPLKKQAYFTK